MTEDNHEEYAALLGALAHRGPSTTLEIAVAADLDTRNALRLLERLERRRLVRRAGPDLWALTDRGERQAAKA